MPICCLNLAKNAASTAGFVDFLPDACLINRYEVGAKLSLHQDKNERDFAAPIVSVSLGVPAIFILVERIEVERIEVERIEETDQSKWR
jgi:alkylated DNA repair protein (DNA oxidative demethylase)